MLLLGPTDYFSDPGRAIDHVPVWTVTFKLDDL